MSTERSTPSQDELDALLECFRYGDVAEGDFDDIRRFTEQYGDEWLHKAKDDRGNTPLHMAGGNGHEGEARLSHAVMRAPLGQRRRMGQ